MWTTFSMNNRRCHQLSAGDGPVFIWPFFPFRENELVHMEEVLEAELSAEGASGYTIIACEVTDWNLELSPWKADSIDGSMLGGGGPELLGWIQESLIPWCRQQEFSADKIYMMGYSLAGLFAMWSLYETDFFDGGVCCSSSFWMEGWSEYAREHFLGKRGSVYLSLGGKEEKSKNPLMATVGDRTREMEKLLKADPMVDKVTLEMNGGGHFADSAKRLAKGMKWVLR